MIEVRVSDTTKIVLTAEKPKKVKWTKKIQK
jgi:ribosomal protein L24E